jgi:hypothetical protein
MRQDRREINDPGTLVDGGCLYRGYLMLPENLAHDIEPARQRRIAKGLFGPSWSIRTYGRNKRLLWIDEFTLGLGQSRG